MVLQLPQFDRHATDALNWSRGVLHSLPSCKILIRIDTLCVRCHALLQKPRHDNFERNVPLKSSWSWQYPKYCRNERSVTLNEITNRIGTCNLSLSSFLEGDPHVMLSMDTLLHACKVYQAKSGTDAGIEAARCVRSKVLSLSVSDIASSLKEDAATVYCRDSKQMINTSLKNIFCDHDIKSLDTTCRMLSKQFYWLLDQALSQEKMLRIAAKQLLWGLQPMQKPWSHSPKSHVFQKQKHPILYLHWTQNFLPSPAQQMFQRQAIWSWTSKRVNQH